jgi:peroxiredoxin
MLGLGLAPTILVGCGGAGGGSESSSQLPLGSQNYTPLCGTATSPPCVRNYHLSVHTSGGVSSDLVFDWSETRRPGDSIGMTGGAQVFPGQAYTFKAVPEDAKLWLQLNGKSIPDSGTFDLNLTPGFDNTLFAYVAIMPGDPAPEFKGLDANGQLHRLSALRGKWVLVTFGDWGCPGAREFAPALSSMYTRYHAAGLEALSVLLCPNMELRLANSADLEEWTQTYGCNYPVIIDADNATQYYNREYLNCNSYSCSDQPSIFLIDPQGTIAQRYRGWDANDGLGGELAKVYA